MSRYTFQHDRWSSPRPYSDASLRLMKHGPIQMDEPTGLLSCNASWAKGMVFALPLSAIIWAMVL